MKEQWNKFWTNNYKPLFTKISWTKRRMIKILDNYVKKDFKVLDAGCGSGFFSKYFLDKECRVWACDYSIEALNLTKEITENRCDSYIRKDLLNENSWNDYRNFFDIVFSDGLLEHFNHAQQQIIIKNFISLKKREGIIITFVPNVFSWWRIVRPLLMPGIQEKPFTMNQLKLLHSPLKIIKSGGINILPIRYSPDDILGSKLGMIIYVVAK